MIQVEFATAVPVLKSITAAVTLSRFHNPGSLQFYAYGTIKMSVLYFGLVNNAMLKTSLSSIYYRDSNFMLRKVPEQKQCSQKNKKEEKFQITSQNFQQMWHNIWQKETKDSTQNAKAQSKIICHCLTWTFSTTNSDTTILMGNVSDIAISSLKLHVTPPLLTYPHSNQNERDR